MAELLDYLRQAVEDGASDLFIVAGGEVCEKLDKRMVPISEGRVFFPKRRKSSLWRCMRWPDGTRNVTVGRETMIFPCPFPIWPGFALIRTGSGDLWRR